MKKIALLGVLLGTLTFQNGCDVFDKTATAEFETATKCWNAGDYQTAVALYYSLVRKHPRSSKADDALYWAGVTEFLYVGETEKALQTLRLLLKRYPQRDMAPHAQWYIAQIYDLGYNDYGRAIEEYRKAAEYPNREVREKSLYGLAECLFRVRKTEEARETWTKQVDLFPDGTQSRLAYFRLGTVAFSRGEIAKAKDFYRKTLEHGADKELAIKVKFSLAECLEAEDSLRDALALYQEILPVDPNPERVRIKINALETRIRKKSY